MTVQGRSSSAYAPSTTQTEPVLDALMDQQLYGHNGSINSCRTRESNAHCACAPQCPDDATQRHKSSALSAIQRSAGRSEAGRRSDWKPESEARTEHGGFGQKEHSMMSDQVVATRTPRDLAGRTGPGEGQQLAALTRKRNRALLRLPQFGYPSK